MDQTVILAIARHLLTLGGGYLVSRGLLDAGSVETLAGALLAAGSIGWSIVQKWQTHAAVVNAAATQNPVQPTIASPVKAAVS